MNFTPDEKEIAALFEGFLPASSARLEHLLSDAPWTARKVARRRVMGAALAVLAAAALLMAATPQGRALAQELLDFFVHTESNTQAVPTVANVAEVAAAADQPQPLLQDAQMPFQAECGDIYVARCSLGQISQMVDFPIQALPESADGPSFLGATGGPQRIILTYMQTSVNGTILLFEEPQDADGQPRPVGVSAQIEEVRVNDHEGQYVQGTWYSIGADDGISWTSEPFAQTLAWTQDEVQFTMVFRAGKDVGRLLDKADLIDLAQQLTTDLPASAALTPSRSVDLQALSRQAGFEVDTPEQLPKGYQLFDASFNAEQSTACLFYTYGDGVIPTMAIAQRLSSFGDIQEDITITMVDVDGVQVIIPVVPEPMPMEAASGGQATLISNGVQAGQVCPYPDYHANQALYWQSGDKTFVVFGLINQHQGGVFLTYLEMQRLAQDLLGMQLTEQVDPGRLDSVDAAQGLASFEVKAPTQMVAGLHLDHIAYIKNDYEETVKVSYVPNGVPTHGGIDYGLFITQAAGEAPGLDDVEQWGGFEPASVNGQFALYRLGCWETPSGRTDCSQELYWYEGGVTYNLLFNFPGALEPDQLILIAESLH